MRIVHVADFEACALTRQATGSKGRNTTFMRHFCERICLIHELRQLIRPEERIDDTGDRSRIHEVLGRNRLTVAKVHTLTNRSRHA